MSLIDILYGLMRIPFPGSEQFAGHNHLIVSYRQFVLIVQYQSHLCHIERFFLIGAGR